MSLTSIMNAALTTLSTSQTALRATSANIANVNTPDYVRRETMFEAGAIGGQLTGVSISEVRRMVATFLGREMLTLSSGSARSDAENRLLDRVQALFGDPKQPGSLGNLLSSVSGALDALAIDPSNAARKQATLSSLQNLAGGVADLAANIQSVRADVESEIRATLTEANELIARIHALNPQIQRATLQGDTSSGLLDQRDAAVRRLSEIMNVRTIPQGDGRVFLATTDGVALVSEFSARLAYTGPTVLDTGARFPEILIERINTDTGAVIGQPTPLEPHLADGKLRGLLDIRNNALPRLGQELGALAGAIADQLNAAHNDATAVPPPSALAGRNTGLAASDALNFTGRTTVAIADATGALVRRVDVDFTAGTLSVDGGGATAFPATVGGFAAALNAALGGAGTASFAGGALTIAASTPGQGVFVQQDATTPSARAGKGFAHFFGLNDLVQARAPGFPSTGFTAAEPHALAPGGSIELSVRGPSGDILRSATVAVTGTTIADMIGALNAGFSGVASFALGANGTLTMTPAVPGARLETGLDTTNRAGTGLSFTQVFGLGLKQELDRAMDFRVRAEVMGDVRLLATARPELAGALPGARVLGAGDGGGARLLAGFADAAQTFGAIGHLPAITGSVKDFAAALMGGVGLRAATAEAAAEDAKSLLSEVQQRTGEIESVNLDEELANMIKFQQSFNAGARIVQTVQELYDALLRAV